MTNEYAKEARELMVRASNAVESATISYVKDLKWATQLRLTALEFADPATQRASKQALVYVRQAAGMYSAACTWRGMICENVDRLSEVGAGDLERMKRDAASLDRDLAAFWQLEGKIRGVCDRVSKAIPKEAMMTPAERAAAHVAEVQAQAAG